MVTINDQHFRYFWCVGREGEREGIKMIVFTKFNSQYNERPGN